MIEKKRIEEASRNVTSVVTHRLHLFMDPSIGLIPM
jgi:hypothetical protein